MKFEVATSFSVKPIATADLRKVELQVNEILLAAGWDKKFCGLAATPEFFFGKCGVSVQPSHLELQRSRV